MSLTLALTALRPHYTGGESIWLALTLRNDGAVPISIPDPNPRQGLPPVLFLSGPGMSSEHRVSIAPKARQVGTAAYAMIELAPDAVWTEAVDLARIAPPTEEGQYRIRAEFKYGDASISSELCSFDFSASQPRDLRVSTTGSSVGSSISVTWLGRDDSGDTVWADTFTVSGGNDSRIERNGALPRDEVSADTVDPWIPSTNFRPGDDPFRWLIVREGDLLKATTPALIDPLDVALPAGTGPSIGAPTMDATHRTDAIFIQADNAGRRSLIVARFRDPYVVGENAPTALLLPAIPLSSSTIAATVAIEPQELGDRRHVIAISLHEGKIEIVRVTLTDDDTTGAPSTYTFVDTPRSLVALSDAPPAAVVASDGTVHVTAAFGVAGEPNVVALIEAKIPPQLPNAADHSLARSIVGLRVPGPLAAVRIGYFQDGEDVRRDWALWTDDGFVIAGGRGTPRIARRNVQPDAPHLLIVLRDATFVVEIDPAKGPVLGPL